jgi:hypothetical protein
VTQPILDAAMELIDDFAAETQETLDALRESCGPESGEILQDLLNRADALNVRWQEERCQ